MGDIKLKVQTTNWIDLSSINNIISAYGTIVNYGKQASTGINVRKCETQQLFVDIKMSQKLRILEH